MTVPETHRAVEAVWRIEQARIIGSVARLVGDVGLAEELAQDALVAAMEQWPQDGIPGNAAAWLTSVAKRRAIDHLRRRERLDRKVAEIGRDIETSEDQSETELDAVLEDTIEDDLLRLMFVSCHPVLSTEARVALTLRLLGGLTTEEIARAFLVTEATVAQRVVRAKRTLAAKQVPFEVPAESERRARLGSVLEVVYLIFNEGYSATVGADWVRPELCHDAMRLGRLLAGLLPGEAEVHGLVALMEIQASRLPARVDASGEPVLLMDQNRSQWDLLLIRHGLAALNRAESLSATRGPYTLQAAIAACHARARAPEETDWVRMAGLYDELTSLLPSPVVQLNRAVAHGRAFGASAGLALADAVAGEPALRGYHLLPSVRADLLLELGRAAEAVAELDRAAELATNSREQTLLRERAARVRAEAAAG
jgi:RNA polymerase sigma factor (sigma-70 family)